MLMCAKNVTSAGADRQLLKPEPRRRLHPDIAGCNSDVFVRDLLWRNRPHHLHLFTDLSSDESILRVETSSGARSVLTGQYNERHRVSSVLFSLFPSCMLRIHLPLSPSPSASLVELNLTEGVSR